MKGTFKFRGITPNYHSSKLVNFEVIRAMIFEQGESLVNVQKDHKFKRKISASGTVDLVTEP